MSEKQEQHVCNDDSPCRFYNNEHLLVCKITGRVFKRRVCDEFIDSNRGICNSDIRNYAHAQKRNQQIKNRKIEFREVMNIINDIDFLSKYSGEIIRDFCTQILDLWKIFIQEIEKYDFYVHRNARRCFVVSIIYNLKSGLHTLSGCVIKAHPNINVTNLNKKKSYKFFKIRDIRYGNNIIKKVLEKRSVIAIKLKD